MRTRILRLAAAAVATALIAVAPAQAAGPVRSSFSITIDTPLPNFECGPHGYPFDVLATFSVRRTSLSFYGDPDQTVLLKEVREVTFSGTLYRSDDLTRTIPYGGRWTRTQDEVAGTITTAGLFRYSHPDGSGMRTLSAGRQVIDLSADETLSEAGRVPSAWEADVCAYLAA